MKTKSELKKTKQNNFRRLRKGRSAGPHLALISQQLTSTRPYICTSPATLLLLGAFVKRSFAKS